MSGFYIGGAYSYANADIDGDANDPQYTTAGSGYKKIGSGDLYQSGYMLLAGYQYNEYIAFEGRYWGSNSEMTAHIEGGGTYNFYDTNITAWGIFLKPMYPLSESLNVYGLLGYGNTEIDVEIEGDNINLLDENGFQWGIGAAYVYSEDISFFVDYVQLANNGEESFLYYDTPVYTETSLYTVNVGVTYKF